MQMDDGGKAAREATALSNVAKPLQDASRKMSNQTQCQPRSTMAAQEPSHSPLENLPSASDIRRILGPLIASNAQARAGSSALGKDTLHAEPQGGFQDLLTDEVCDRFAEQMQVVEEGEEISSNRSSSMNDKKIPKAPRAMLMSKEVRASGGVLPKQNRNKFSNTKSPVLDLRIPITISLPTTPADSQEATLPVPSPTPATEGIAVPLVSTDSKEPEEGEIMGSSSPPRTPPHALRNASSFKRYYASGREYSTSPEPVRHNLPASRTYRSQPPLEGINYHRTSQSSRSPRSLRRSQSPPIHTRRQSSERVRQPSQRRSSPTFPRPSVPTAPISLHSVMQQRRSSHYDGKNESDTRKDNGNPDKYAKSPTFEEKDNAHSVAPLGDHTSDHERRRSFTRFDAGSTRPQIPTRSMPLPNTKPNHHVDIISQNCTSPPGDQNNVFDTKLTASPLSMITSLPDPPECESSPHDQAQVAKPCHEVPGLWMVKAGGNSVEIVTCEFEIDKVTADRWGIGPSRHGEEKARNALSLSLLCIPLSDIAVQAKLGVMSATRQEIVDEITQIEIVWPPPGYLVVEINPDHDWGRSWLPRHMRKEHPSIDITYHVHEGMNIIRLIQLAGLADCLFVVLAKEKPPNVDANDLEPVPDTTEMEAEEPQTTKQLLASFRPSTRIIYS